MDSEDLRQLLIENLTIEVGYQDYSDPEDSTMEVSIWYGDTKIDSSVLN